MKVLKSLVSAIALIIVTFFASVYASKSGYMSIDTAFYITVGSAVLGLVMFIKSFFCGVKSGVKSGKFEDSIGTGLWFIIKAVIAYIVFIWMQSVFQSWFGDFYTLNYVVFNKDWGLAAVWEAITTTDEGIIFQGFSLVFGLLWWALVSFPYLALLLILISCVIPSFGLKLMAMHEAYEADPEVQHNRQVEKDAKRWVNTVAQEARNNGSVRNALASLK